jgi:cytochrome c oxidase subunit 2
MRRSTARFLAVAATAAFVLAACGDSDESTDTAGAEATESDPGHDDGGHDENSTVADGAREIEVTASSFEFDPEEITVTAGEDVAILLTSADLLHDFTVEGLDAHVVADADETVEGGLRADEPGEYTYYCSVAGHREAGMEGTLIVDAR